MSYKYKVTRNEKRETRNEEPETSKMDYSGMAYTPGTYNMG